MKKILILSFIIAGMFFIVSCADNHSSENENTAETTVKTTALTEAATAEATTEKKKEYDYVHGEDGYYNIADEMTEFEMKSQRYGTCWLYAASASMETSYFKKNGSYISIDPFHLLDIVYLDEKKEGIFIKEGTDAKEVGGFQWVVTERLSSGFDDLVLDSSVILDVNDREAIKENIRTRGGVAVGVFDNDNSKIGKFGAYRTINYHEDSNFDHAITIIGYDDYFPKEYFKEPASEDGAWITYNSNNTASFYYVSYDAPLEQGISHSVTDQYGEVLSYDAGDSHSLISLYTPYAEALGLDTSGLESRYVKTEGDTKTANVFHKSGKLAAVGTYNDFDEQDIKIEIYDAGIQNLLYSQDATLGYRGYHTIELDTPVDVIDYAIVVTYTKGAPVEGESIDFGQFDDKALSEFGCFEYKTVSGKGQSFVYIDHNWKDMTDSDIKDVLKVDFEPNNCCIKAIYK